MKLFKAVKLGFCALGSILFVTACTNTDKPLSVLPPTKGETKNVNPFPFYKNLQIKPGFNFEVVSWGKGVDTLGGYLLLMSDSAKNNYKSMSVERKGLITDAWNMDLDNDGNPELYVQYVVRKNVNDLNVYEYSNGSFNKIGFPGLKENLKKGYEGNDKFFVKNGDLFRTVPIVNVDSGKTTTLIKTIKYKLSGNNFSTSEVKPEE